MPGHNKESALGGVIDAVDIFNGSVELTLRGKRVISSRFGGLLTIGLIIFIFYQFMIQCVAMFNYEDPQLVQTNELEEDPAIVSLNQDSNFFLAIQITVNSVNVDLTQVSPFNWQSSVTKVLKNADGSTTTTQNPLLWRPCLESDFPESVYGPNIYTTYQMSVAFCLYGVNRTFSSNGTCPEEVASLYPDCITPPNFDIVGTALSDDYEYLQFIATFCNASDPNLAPYIQCDPNMYTKFQSLEVKFVIYYANTVLLPTNHMQPNRTIFDTTYWETGLMMEKFATVYVDRVTVQNYDDFVFADKYENYSFFQINDNGIREQENYFESQSTTAPLLQFTICRSNLNLVVTRTYAKVIDYLTDLGGFSKTLMFIAGFLAMGYIRHKYHVVIANELFDFELSESNSINISPRKGDSGLNSGLMSPNELEARQRQSLFSFDMGDAKALMIDSNSNPSSPSSFAFRSRAMPSAQAISNDNTVWEYFKKQKERRNRLDPSTMGFFRYHLSFWCKKKRTRESLMIDEAKKAVTHELNIATIISKLKEVERLKAILLNPTQREAFEFIEKPLIENSRDPRRDLRRLNSAAVNRRPTKSRTANSHVFDSWKRTRQEKYFKKEFESLPRYEKLYTAYQYLENDRDPSNKFYNQKLLRMMDQDLIKVFKRVDMLLHHEPDTDKFDDLLKELSEGPKQTKHNRMQTC